MQTQVTRAGTPIPLAARIGFFLFTASVFLLFARGRITSIDEWHVYGTTESLVERRSWQLQLPGSDSAGRQYSRYSVVPSVLGVPFYAAARAIVGVAPTESSSAAVSPRDFLQAAVSFQTPFLTAATALIILCLLRRLGIGAMASFSTATIFAFATLAFPYSSSLYVQPVASLALVWLVASVLLHSNWATALSLALLLAVRIELVVLLPAFALHLRRERAGRAAWVGLASGMLIGVGSHFVVNLLRGDSVGMGDYDAEAFTTPLWIGLHGLFFSSGKGLLWFAPAAVLGLLTLPICMRRTPQLGWLVATLVAVQLIMVACWWTWHGGWSWGPRLVLPIMPLAVLPLAWVFDEWLRYSAMFRLLVVTLITLSVDAQLRGVLSDPVGDRGTLGPLLMNENESIYIPQTGPWSVASPGPDLVVLRWWLSMPEWRTGIVLTVIVLLVVGSLAAWVTLRSMSIDFKVSSRTMLSGLSPGALCAVAGAMVLVGAPAILETALVGRDAVETDQFGRLQSTASRRAAGRLYAPLSGDYTFYRMDGANTQIWIDGQPLFRGSAAAVAAEILPLEAGFHRIELVGDRSRPGPVLYWTTPGNAQYKQRVPRLYLVEPGASWRANMAIAVAHWRWLVWVLGATVFLALAREKGGPKSVPCSVV